MIVYNSYMDRKAACKPPQQQRGVRLEVIRAGWPLAVVYNCGMDYSRRRARMAALLERARKPRQRDWGRLPLAVVYNCCVD